MFKRTTYNGNDIVHFSDGSNNHLVFLWNSENKLSGRSGRYQLKDLKQCPDDSCEMPTVPKGWRFSGREFVIIDKRLQEFKSKRIIARTNQLSSGKVSEGGVNQ